MLAGLMLLAVAPAAQAQRNAYQAEGEVGRLLQDARSYYDNLELESAEDALARAIALSERFQIRSPVVAEVFIQRGILYFVRDRDEAAASADFTRAMNINNRARLDPMVSTPTLERLFEESRRQAGGGGGAPPPRDPGPVDPPPNGGGNDGWGPPDTPDGIQHTPPTEARGGEALNLSIEVDGALNRQIYRVFAYYRSVRAELVQKVEMRPAGPTTFTARVPGRFVAGRRLQYYIVAEDRTGRIVAQVRSAKDPIEVAVRGDALGGVDAMASGGSLDGSGGGGGDGNQRRFVTLGVSLGTGGGLITEKAKPETLRDKRISPGFALAPFHTLIEADVWPHERFAIGAFARLQVVEFSHLEGARLKFKAVTGEKHNLILRAGGGFGRVRHLVDLGVGLDTTLEGPYMYTLGATYAYRLAPRFDLIITPDFLHLIGDSPSLHFDLNLGVQTSF